MTRGMPFQIAARCLAMWNADKQCGRYASDNSYKGVGITWQAPLKADKILKIQHQIKVSCNLVASFLIFIIAEDFGLEIKITVLLLSQIKEQLSIREIWRMDLHTWTWRSTISCLISTTMAGISRSMKEEEWP